jgi:uncharacterized membrane protein YeaQ/YmgE (transglycosylase-associated protein family)
MWLIWPIVIGVLAGWIAARVLKERASALFVDLLVGILGSVLGGLMSRYLGVAAHRLIGRLALSVLAAVFFLIVQHVVKQSKRAR